MLRLCKYVSEFHKPLNSDLSCLASKCRKMSENNSKSFVQHYNHICSKMEWKVVNDDYDYNQEIATSCYGDMLHDTERNQKFALALEKAIKKMHSLQKKAHVLDIGTGTGLLSMLAVKYGADSVVACEAFLPMANCAIRIIEENKFSDKIKVVKKHSTSLTVGEDGDMKVKANILVSEVFDTELIGEGAIKTFNHAHKYLLEEDCIVIPSAGMIYAQLVESDLAMSWHQIQDWEADNECLLRIPEEIKKCPGAAAVHDIQLSQFNPIFFKLLSKSIPVFRFDWSSKDPITTHRQSDVMLTALTSGKAQVVFMWWDLIMDPEGEIILSCAPVWEHPDSKDEDAVRKSAKGNPAKSIPWRDHWMQAVYFLSEAKMVDAGESITLNCYHDEFSFWFKLHEKLETGSLSAKARPVCECGVHFLVSRTRVGALNCSSRRNFYYEALKKLIKPEVHYVVLGDMTLLGLLASKLGAKKVFVLESSPPIRKVVKSISRFNALENVAICSSLTQLRECLINSGSRKISILSEPFFRNSVLPYDNITFWYMKESLLRELREFNPNRKLAQVTVAPHRAAIRCCAVEFDDLWKIARRLNHCEGMSMRVFDDLIETAKTRAGNYVEPQPLWEYPGVALTAPFAALEMNVSEDIPTETVRNRGKVEFPLNCRCDGVAVWMEYCFGDDRWLVNGPTRGVAVGEYVAWDMFERQGVHLFRNSKTVKEGDFLSFDVAFKPESGELIFNFSVSDVSE